jgi:hypothetical protein
MTSAHEGVGNASIGISPPDIRKERRMVTPFPHKLA